MMYLETNNYNITVKKYYIISRKVVVIIKSYSIMKYISPNYLLIETLIVCDSI